MPMGQTSKSARKLWQNSSYRQRVIESTARGKATSESIAKRSQSSRDLWRNSDYLEKMADRPPPNKLSEDERVKKICPVCNQTFSVLPCKSKKITCSQECRKARKIKRGAFKQSRKCESCDRDFAPLQHKQPCCKVCVPTAGAGVRWRKFRLSQPSYEGMLLEQELACKICRKSFDDLPSNQIHLDHNHRTNKVRGILCQRCNTLVGSIESNRHLLEKVEAYIAI